MKTIMNRTRIFALSGLGLLVLGISAPAQAAIECRDGQQFNSAAAGWIPSSFCGDELIAQVARRQGMAISGSQIRKNPLLKAEACRFVSSNTRVSHLCIGDRPEDNGDSSRK